ncbi:MAG: hypothetical protein K1X89_06680 [Myxococcaceae bacterium]|nr:hypothetical protein [Myxococcaceae bacterium]
MSVTMAVFLKRAYLPETREWAQAIRSSGFDMVLDPEVEVASASGFWPCTYAGVNAGFEFSAAPVVRSELGEDVLEELGDRDLMVTFVTHSDMRELMTSNIAAAVLCSITDGVLWDTEANELTPASKALVWGKTAEREIQKEL